MNGEVNCILSVCCPEGSEASKQALAREMAKGLDSPAGRQTSEACYRYAAWIVDHFDLAEKGTLAPLKASIARLAREPRG